MDIEVSELEASPDEFQEVYREISSRLENHDIGLVLQVLANLAATGIRGSAIAQGIGCVGWAYRVADEHAENVKLALATNWSLDAEAKKPDAINPIGSC